MNNVNHTITINAPASKVWDVLWQDESYRKWTSVFGEGGSTRSDWKEGSSIHFCDAQGSGMFSVIQTLDAPRTMIFKHLGMLHEGKEVPPTPETEAWFGHTEEYYLNEESGVTTLSLSMFSPENYLEMFNTSFVKGLAIVKELSEN